jgi:L-amino acid N-acyltransferase YncA
MTRAGRKDSPRNSAARTRSSWQSFSSRVVRRLKNLQVVRWVRSERYLLLYAVESEAAQPASRDDGLRQNRLEDLALFEQTERWLSREAFISEAQKRVGNGAKLYTAVSGDRLVHYGWLIPRQKEAWFPYVQQKYVFPPGSAMLYNAYTHPDARGTGLHQRSMRRRIFDAARQAETRRVYTAIESGNLASRAVASRVGFKCVDVLYERIRFGRVERGRLSPEEYFAAIEPKR